MERRIEEDVEGWPTRPFEDGYEGLRQLGSADFSGVVRAGGTWVFFVNGKIVGVFDGELEDVDEAAGTAHKAPHPSLPLLYAMQATGGDTRAKYYTNDTPISEVHQTLSSGSFTGYIELSENVLSGDYYQLYHGGRSMSVAFVGNSGRMITGEDAFERADDEVGIYEVVDVDIQVSDVPDPDGAGAGAAASADAGQDDSEDAEDPDAETATDDSDDEATADDEPDPAAEPAPDESDPDVDDGDDARASRADQESETANAASAADSDPEPTDEPEEATAAEPAPPADTGTSRASTSANEPDDSDDGGSARERTTSDTATRAGSGAGTDEPSEAASAAGSTTEEERAADEPDRGTASSSSRTGSRDRRSETNARGRSPTDDAGATPVEPATEQSTRAEAGGDEPDGGAPQRSEAAWREATTVPSLDPDNSDDGAPAVQAQAQSAGRGSNATAAQQSTTTSRGQSRGQSRNQQSKRRSRSESSQGGSASGRGRSGDVDDTLEEEVLEREDHIDRLQQRVENLEDDRDEIAEERDQLQDRVESLTEENESLRAEIRELEAEIEELEDAAERAGPTDAGGAAGGGGAGGVQTGGSMTPRAAMEGTDLFVRYDSKSAPTLEAAHDGSADAAEVNENLRLDVHTQFEDEGVTVDGEPFEAFLQETMAYRFVEWLVRTLPYEIRETRSIDGLRDCYDALPEVDRVEFHGEVARDAVEGEEGSPSETFDVVVRDKMGEALFVANMNDARDPATGRMIVDLQEAAGRVKEHSMALSSAFFVTRSFFEPAALETASEATSGSLLSRDSRKSYVKLSRKQGYHLCLVEARGEDLHLNVPEL